MNRCRYNRYNRCHLAEVERISPNAEVGHAVLKGWLYSLPSRRPSWHIEEGSDVERSRIDHCGTRKHSDAVDASSTKRAWVVHILVKPALRDYRGRSLRVLCLYLLWPRDPCIQSSRLAFSKQPRIKSHVCHSSPCRLQDGCGDQSSGSPQTEILAVRYFERSDLQGNALSTFERRR